MKLLSALVLAIAAAASGAAAAAQYSSDQERRDQNRSEAMSKWHAMNDGRSGTAGASMSRTSTGERSMTRRERVRERTHQGASSVRNFTHRQAEKARRFGDRQDRRYGHGKTRANVNTSPEGGGGK